jgi:hypothetical protein
MAYKKDFTFDERRAYHARRTVAGSRLGSGVTRDKLEYSVGFSLGADYADGKSANGSKMNSLRSDGHVKRLLAEKEKSDNVKGFLAGFFGFIDSCKK